jgi:hypothetical protein
MKRLTTHPLHHELQKEPLNRLKRKRNLHTTRVMQKEHQDIIESDPDLCEDLVITKWSSKCLIPEIELNVPGLEQKGTLLTEVQKALTLEMIDQKYPQDTWTHVYTDGSSQDAVRNGGSGVFIKFPD